MLIRPYLASTMLFMEAGSPRKWDVISSVPLWGICSKRWADGRDGGLTEIDRNSEEAFRKWYEDGQQMGGHPWEIYRGGNSTHIDMAVVQPEYGEKKTWKIMLTAFSSTRLAETCRIILALHAAGLPFELHDEESYLLRLMGTDWVGIVPKQWGIRYSWHEFPKDWHVADCIHYEWFKDDRTGKSLRPMRQIRSLVTWFPLPPIRLRS